ncbi:MAG: SRPBCC family protein [Parvibaculum sp.]|uniref:SRPBCC family protein n=1 Tax=Parvibaculum sp. TaxID=2024848 RepID=UPI0025DFE864|nr:SRPBCC family protein [Parvibaculum sp.]MCE9650037.1 SRPBCC family protein [Parvibaculum sp.]
MSARSAIHSTFTIKRLYDATPTRVFAAWSTPEKTRWFVGPDNWDKSNHQIDFRVGGAESVSGGPAGGPVHYYDARFQDIVPNERIVSTYDMHLDEVRISVSLATVVLTPEGKGTRLVYTEQGVFLDGHDDAGSRERGTRDLLDNLEAHLARHS